MEMKAVQQLRQTLEMRIAPQQILSMDILQLPILDLRAKIAEELSTNPAIEMKDDPADAAAHEARPDAADFYTQDPVTEKLSDSASYREYFDASRSRPAPTGEKDKKLEAMQNTAARDGTLQDHLLSQLYYLDLTEIERIFGEEIILNINRDGYLEHTLEEIKESAGMADLTVEEMEDILAIIQRMEPTGIGARDLKECLLLQLGENGSCELERKLIADHLQDLAKNRLPRVARATGHTIGEIKDALLNIRRLTPTPGALYSNEVPHYVVPDVRVEDVDGVYEVIVESSYLPNVVLNDDFRRFLRERGTDKKTKQFIRSKWESGKWLIDAVNQRRNTLLRVSRAIVEYQKEFLDRGLEYLKPLKMQTIATLLGLHQATVYRAVAGKYIQTPRGIFPMKDFFTRALSGVDGEEQSNRVIKHKIAEIVDAEDKRNPLSDDDIANILRESNTDIARRTVAKYRKLLDIPSSRERREF